MKIISEKKVFDAGIFTVSKINLVKNNRDVVHSVIRFVETMCVLPVTRTGKIILENQFRTPVNRYLFEIPAGKIDKGESPEECLVRELEEETGLRALSFKKAFEAYVTCGYSDEYMHYFVALTEKIPDRERKHFPDSDEEIELLEITVEKGLEMIRNREIIDSKTITMINSFAARQVGWE